MNTLRGWYWLPWNTKHFHEGRVCGGERKRLVVWSRWPTDGRFCGFPSRRWIDDRFFLFISPLCCSSVWTWRQAVKHWRLLLFRLFGRRPSRPGWFLFLSQSNFYLYFKKKKNNLWFRNQWSISRRKEGRREFLVFSVVQSLLRERPVGCVCFVSVVPFACLRLSLLDNPSPFRDWKRQWNIFQWISTKLKTGWLHHDHISCLFYRLEIQHNSCIKVFQFFVLSFTFHKPRNLLIFQSKAISPRYQLLHVQHMGETWAERESWKVLNTLAKAAKAGQVSEKNWYLLGYFSFEKLEWRPFFGAQQRSRLRDAVDANCAGSHLFHTLSTITDMCSTHTQHFSFLPFFLIFANQQYVQAF